MHNSCSVHISAIPESFKFTLELWQGGCCKNRRVGCWPPYEDMPVRCDETPTKGEVVNALDAFTLPFHPINSIMRTLTYFGAKFCSKCDIGIKTQRNQNWGICLAFNIMLSFNGELQVKHWLPELTLTDVWTPGNSCHTWRQQIHSAHSKNDLYPSFCTCTVV